MDFTHSEEPQMLADSLRRCIDTEYNFEKRRRSARGGNSFDRAIWSSLAEMGVLGRGIASAYGGFGEGLPASWSCSVKSVAAWCSNRSPPAP